MRIREIKNIISNNIGNFNFKSESVGGNFSLKELNKFRRALYELENSKLLIQDINDLKSSLVFQTGEDNIVVSSQELNRITLLKNNLSKLFKNILLSLESISGGQSENTISIKLPEIHDLEDLNKILNDIQSALQQAIINVKINGQIKIVNVESGSIWFDIFLGSMAALNLVGGLAWASAVVYKKIQEGKIFEQHARGLEIKNESLVEIQKAQKKSIDLLIDAEARNLYDEHFSNDDKEQISRLKHSINLFSKLMERGTEIHPLLNTPETVDNLFPDPKNYLTIQSRIKQISNE
jgi:hypothetical protein